MRGNSNLMLDAQRRLARTILIGLVSAMVMFVLFASGPNIGLTFAQQPTAQYQVEFLNPSGTNFSKTLSEKRDIDNRYHLVAWVNELPPDPSVEFRYLDTAQNREVTIGTATQTGISDTFDLLWDIPDSMPEESDVTLYAVLFSGGNEVDRDTQTADVNNQDPDPNDPTDLSAPQAETVEVNYPIDGGAWGLFTPRDRATAGVINVTLSADATWVRVVYTVTSPGQEPAWTTCGQETAANAANGVRCTLATQHRGTQVTAVGAVANTSGASYSAANDQSADAHRVQHYEQVPDSITVEPANQDSVRTGQCSAVITATIKDQFGVPLPNANLDVHAQGPNDEIAFDDGSSSSPNRAPQTGHSQEPARACSDDPPTASAEQAEHDSPDNDIKHIESIGTDDAGTWSFRLFSPGLGSTQFTVWSDLDDDDNFCSSEESASGAVGWDQTSGGITGVPSQISSCPSPSPSTPNPGPSTPGPTPTGTASPDPRGCTHTGTDGAEKISGTSGDDIICAGGGNDIVRGLGGDDIIYGEDGADNIHGSGGDDVIYAGSGKDTVRGNGGRDRLFGQADNDIITGGQGNDRGFGGGGVDTIRGNDGKDNLKGRSGNDVLTGGGANDRLAGGRGKDSLAGGRGRDRCFGNGGRDSFRSCERRRQ